MKTATPLSAADALRRALTRCENQVLGLARAESDPLDFLRALDYIAGELDALEKRGANLQAERVRLNNVSGQLRQYDAQLVKQMGAALAEQRPADARWWWYLDQQIARRCRRQLTRGLALGAGAVLVLLAVWLIYDRWIAPPPHVRRALVHISQGERAWAAGDREAALSHFTAAALADSQSVEARLWLGTLQQREGRAQAADEAFAQTRALLEASLGDAAAEEFFVQRGLLYLEQGNLPAALDDAASAIAANPQSAAGYFVLGQVAEFSGDVELALAAFGQAAELAQESGNDQLWAAIRVRLAILGQP